MTSFSSLRGNKRYLMRKMRRLAEKVSNGEEKAMKATVTRQICYSPKHEAKCSIRQFSFVNSSPRITPYLSHNSEKRKFVLLAKTRL